METSFSSMDVALLLRIAGEVNELDSDVTIRRAHILNRLLGLIGGCSAVCSELDPRHADQTGWAIPNSITCSGGLTPHQRGLIDHYLRGNLSALDPCVPHLLRNPAPVATIRRTDVIDRSWFRSDHFNEVRRPLGFGESIYAKFVAPDGRRLKLSFHREMNDTPYTERHAQLLQLFNQNLANLYVLPRTEHSQETDARIDSLPARVRPVLQRLLAGDAEKQAALKLGLSPHTVHEYTKLLYRTFGVNSRGELLAQFVTGLVC
jgi:DNA-binding CsgD family transcriptional regulator